MARPELPRLRTHRRRRFGGIAAAVCLVVVSLGLGLPRMARWSDGHAAVANDGSWRTLSHSPLRPRISSAVAWSGREMLVWGGRGCAGGQCADVSASASVFGDGAAYDPETDGWRAMAAAVIGPRSGAATVWSGRELLVWGGTGPGAAAETDGAAYDPEHDRWRSIAPGPLRAGAAQAAWDGREMLIWSTGGITAYDPLGDSWTDLVPSPLAPRSDVTMTWTGSEVLIWGGSNGIDYFSDGAAYDPGAHTWRSMAASPLTSRLVRGTWTGRELVIWGGEGPGRALDDGAAYDPVRDTWRPLAGAPLASRRGFAEVWTGHELLVWGGAGPTGSSFFGDGAEYDPVDDRWRPLPRNAGRFIPAAVWTGHEMVVWGGIVPSGAAASPPGVSAAPDAVSYAPMFSTRP